MIVLLLGQQVIDKIEELILWIERFRWRQTALLRFVLVVNLLDLTAIDT